MFENPRNFRDFFLFLLSRLFTGVAQLVEHRSPKPSVGRSSRSSRAESRSHAAFLFVHLQQIHHHEGQSVYTLFY
jgi:hypothetical protein